MTERNTNKPAPKNRPMTKPQPLTSQERAALKSMAHPLKPVVQVGGSGLTPGVLQEIRNALEAHELVKVQLPGQSDAVAKKTETEELLAALPPAVHFVNRIGRVVILYLEKPAEQEPRMPRSSL